MRSLRRIVAIAQLTATEGMRQPAYFLLIFVTGGLIAMLPLFAFFNLGEEAKMVTDLGLSSILTFSTLLAVLTASSSVTDEIEGRTALTMLSKPLRREEFLLGKYFGVAVTACSMAAAMAPVLLVTLRSQKYIDVQDPFFSRAVGFGVLLGVSVYGVLLVTRLLFGRGLTLVHAFWFAYALTWVAIFMLLEWKGGPKTEWDWRVLWGIFFICLHAGVIAAMAVALATRCTLVQSFIGTSAFFIIGHASGGIVSLFKGVAVVGPVVRAILPDLDQFNIIDALATGFMDQTVKIPPDVIIASTLYAFLYSVALLALAVALFRKRELG